jgi:hypothetical protein
MRMLERMSGKGVIPEREKQKVAYDLGLLQEEIDVGPDEPPLLGLKKVVGTVLPVVALGVWNTLVMADGRKFKFCHHHADGSITSTGPIE